MTKSTNIDWGKVIKTMTDAAPKKLGGYYDAEVWELTDEIGVLEEDEN